MIQRYFSILTLVICCIISPSLVGQGLQSDYAVVSMLDSVSFCGRLANGFTFFIVKNVDDERKVELHFVNKSGINQESTNQVSVAHVIEHSPYHGTQNFKKNPWIYFGSKGVEKGEDMNASTSDNATTYQFSIREDDDLTIRDALIWFRDIADGLKFDSVTVNKCREEVIREAATVPPLEEYFPAVIGVPGYRFLSAKDVINGLQSLKPSAVLEYYQKWYRPDLQAVVIVGNVDVKKMASMVTDLFSNIPARGDSVSTEESFPAFSWKRQVIDVQSPAFSASNLAIYMKSLPLSDNAEANLRDVALVRIFNELLNKRFESTNHKYLDVCSGILSSFEFRFGAPGPDFSVLTTSVLNVRGNHLDLATYNAIRELNAIKLRGFSQAELTVATSAAIKRIQAYSYNSSHIAGSLVGAFVYQKHILDPKKREALVLSEIRGLTLKTINDFGNRFIQFDACDFVFCRPVDGLARPPSAAAVDSAINKTAAIVLTEKFEEPKAADELVFTKRSFPVSNPTIQRTARSGDVVRVELSNGITIYFKNVNDSSARGKIAVTSVGRIALDEHAEGYLPAIFAPLAVNQSGLANLKASQFSAYLKSHSIEYIRSYVNNNSYGFEALGHVGSLRLALQIVNEMRWNPQFDPAVVDNLKVKMYEGHTKSVTPKEQLNDTINYFLDIQPILYPETKVGVQSVNVLSMRKEFRHLFQDKIEESIAVIGDLSDTSVYKMVIDSFSQTRELGSSTGRGPDEQVHDLNGKQIVIASTSDSQAEVKIFFSGDYVYSGRNNQTMRMLSDVLQDVLFARLRSKEGGTYSVGVGSRYWNLGSSARYSISISFYAASENVGKLVEATRQEIKVLRKRGASEAVITAAKLKEQRRLNKNAKNLRYWSTAFQEQILAGFRMSDVLISDESSERLFTNAECARAARRYLRKKNSIFFIVGPPIRLEDGSRPGRTRVQ